MHCVYVCVWGNVYQYLQHGKDIGYTLATFTSTVVVTEAIRTGKLGILRDLGCAPYALYGVEYIDLVPLADGVAYTLVQW